MSLYIDLSQFFLHPITTGIQRIMGELCKYAPRGAFTPVRFETEFAGYIAFDPGLIEAIAEYFDTGSVSGAVEITRLSSAAQGRRISFSRTDRVLVPEVFDHAYRLAFFRQLPDDILAQFRFIAFDMLPLTHPEYFWAGTGIYDYFRLLRRARFCGFISEKTRQDYFCRVKRLRPEGGVVLPLGCDSLGPRPALPNLNRALEFTAVGTIEPRKNHSLILEAFEPLLGVVPGLQLSFLGRMGWVSPQFAEKIHRMAADPKSGFRFVSAPADGDIRQQVENSRATVYLSAGEGYGLPPVESLWLGTPVIASDASPSLERIGSRGVHVVTPLDVTNIRRAILAFTDHSYGNKKTQEAFELNLPTWRGFTEEVMKWCLS